MLIPILIGVFFVFMQIAIVWTMFNIRQHTEKQTALHVAQIRLLAKIARNTGTPEQEVNEVLSSTGNKL